VDSPLGAQPPERRRRRLTAALGLGSAAAILLIAISVIAVSKPGKRRVLILGSDTVQRVYGGLPQDGARLGPSDTPVTVTLFNDMQCSSCAGYYLKTTPRLVEDLVREGNSSLVYRHFAMGERDRELSFYGAVAAGQQGREWQYVHLFFANQRQAERAGVTEQFLLRVAEAVPDMEVPQWEQDRRSSALDDTLATDGKLAIDLRLPAQPAVLVDGPAGTRKLLDSPSVEQIEAAVRFVS
jgi:protein-disulfide isomerase